MSPEEIQKQKDIIDSMSQFEMCRLWRFTPAGHAFFVRDTELEKYFSKRFKKSGGFTPEISKELG